MLNWLRDRLHAVPSRVAQIEYDIRVLREEIRDAAAELRAADSDLRASISDARRAIRDLRESRSAATESSEERHKLLAARIDNLDSRVSQSMQVMNSIQQLLGGGFAPATDLETTYEGFDDVSDLYDPDDLSFARMMGYGIEDEEDREAEGGNQEA